MKTPDTRLPDSVWAAVTPPFSPADPLPGDTEAQAVIIGAGFTGLSTALSLAKRGVKVVVIEAAEPGWGASGRNNGQVIPTLTRPNPDDIIAAYGETGERLVQLICDSAENLFRLVDRHGIALAEAEQHGWIQPVHTPGRIKIAQNRVKQWSRYGAPVELLTRDDVIRMTGSPIWHGGFWNRQGGHVNPLGLARGLASAVREAGGTIYCQTPARSIRHQSDRWVVQTDRGVLRADSLMLATHAYTGEFSSDLHRSIAREVVPAISWQLATEPLDETARAQIIPGRQAVSDTHGDLHFMRWDARHRLVTGGALVVRADGAARIKRRIAARLGRIFPVLNDVSIEYVWNGYLGMTNDYLPRFHQIGPNGFAWVGCNGRGVALSVALGEQFAGAMLGASANDLALPLTEPRPLPAHGLIRRIAPLRLLGYRWNDRREIR